MPRDILNEPFALFVRSLDHDPIEVLRGGIKYRLMTLVFAAVQQAVR